jgi:hypothetical protein
MRPSGAIDAFDLLSPLLPLLLIDSVRVWSGKQVIFAGQSTLSLATPNYD